MAYTGALTDTGTDTASDFDINRFEQLLNRLEASKGRQQRQKSVEGRRDIFSQGLASMMGNFWFFLEVLLPWPVACPQARQMLMTGLI